MSSVAMVQQWADRLERRESARSGVPLGQARLVVARRIGVSPGTLENLRRGRIKDPRKSLFDRVRAALIRELESEMRAYEHELQILKQTGADPRGDEIAAVEASLAKARRALE